MKQGLLTNEQSTPSRACDIWRIAEPRHDQTDQARLYICDFMVIKIKITLVTDSRGPGSCVMPLVSNFRLNIFKRVTSAKLDLTPWLYFTIIKVREIPMNAQSHGRFVRGNITVIC